MWRDDDLTQRTLQQSANRRHFRRRRFSSMGRTLKHGFAAALLVCLLGAFAASASAATLVATDAAGANPYDGAVEATALDIVLFNDNTAFTECDIASEFEVDSDGSIDVGDYTSLTFFNCFPVTPTAVNVDDWSGELAADGAGGGDVFIDDIEVSAGPCTYGGPGTEWGADWLNPAGDDPAFIDLLPSSFIPAQTPGELCGTEGAAFDGLMAVETPDGEDLWLLQVP
jgi:hypothetical protein